MEKGTFFKAQQVTCWALKKELRDKNDEPAVMMEYFYVEQKRRPHRAIAEKEHIWNLLRYKTYGYLGCQGQPLPKKHEK